MNTKDMFRVYEENLTDFPTVLREPGGNVMLPRALRPLPSSLRVCHAVPKRLLGKQKMYNLYFKKEYLEACKYCNGRDYNVEAVDAAVQTKEVLSYEVMN